MSPARDLDDEADDDTDAHAVLVTEAPEHLRGYGHSTRGPDDPLVPEVGAEVALGKSFCGTCESQLPPGAVYCSKCGEKIEEFEKH